MNKATITQNLDEELILRPAKHTIAMAIKGLQAVHDGFDANFLAAAQNILAMQGRLIVTGMGKSGHIARKIAATFASTGTPAHFVHPAEASHGDMGMISRGDVVIMLSNSGETAELSEMIAYCKRFGIFLIAIVRRPKSVLVELADIAVILPEIAESSPIGAPTTSTIMMLGYGDALAMAVLSMKGFNNEDFGVLHPGGKLGKTLIRVRDLMRPYAELPLVQSDDLITEVLIIMTKSALGCAIVLDLAGNMAGIITDGDLRRHMQQDFMRKVASQVMTENPLTIADNALAVEALNIMNNRGITSLVVQNQQQLVGLLHLHDCLRAGIA
jgi:arabinose-5-phosphate isomerase